MSCSSENILQFGEWNSVRMLGSGTFGKVILFQNNVTGDMIAVKKCHPESGLLNADGWKKEVEILHNLHHPGLVAALATPEPLTPIGNRDFPLLCMEYCSGGDLRRVLNKPVNCSGLPEKDVLDILKDISNAIIYLHSVKIVHRDLKPENIVLQPYDNNKMVYKLIDLGFAKDLNQQSLCHTLVGTLQYVAPELFYSDTYSCTVDYWSFGLVVHECVTGLRPFLPGLPPMQWMQHVEVKGREDISVSRRPDGNIVYSHKLFKENHLSSVTQSLLEEWLRLMLDWNPKLRGRSYTDPSRPGPVTAFEKLEQILQTEVVSIFWVDGLINLSYAINPETTLETVQDWILRDTGISQHYQLIILPRGNTPDPSRGARQLLSEEEPAMAYLFSKIIDDTDCRVVQNYPELVEVMLSNPRSDTEYPIQKHMWSQSVYFVSQQKSLYKKLLNALKVHSTYLTLRAALLKQQIICISDNLHRASSSNELFTSSLRLDQHNHKLQSQRGGLPSCNLIEKWEKEEIIISSRLNELQSRFSVLEQQLQRIMTNVNDTAKGAGVFLSKPSDALESSVALTHDLFNSLQRRTKEQKAQPESNVPMTKAIVKTLKTRNALFTECFTKMRIVEKCSVEVDSVFPQLLIMKNDLDQFQERMFMLQSDRQNDIWTLLERAVTMWQRTSMMNENLNVPNDRNLLLIPSLSLGDQSSQDSLRIIQENQALRYQIQNSLAKNLANGSLSETKETFFDS